MTTYTFTDNRGIHKHTVTLNPVELAAHLSKDRQFVYYWRNGWEPCLAANRSIYTNPPDEKAPVCPTIDEAQWPEVDAALRDLLK